jgi:hypothetical protein
LLSPSARRLLGRLGWGLAIAAGTIALLALCIPLLLSGPRLARLVERATAPLCGSVRIGGGHLAATGLFDLILGRRARLEIDGLRLFTPAGEEVIAAGRVVAEVTVERNPLRVLVDDMTLDRVKWHLYQRAAGGVTLSEVFRRVPQGGSRAQCLVPIVPPPPPPPRSRQPPVHLPTGGTPFAVEIRGATVREVDLLLDFRTWALALPDVDALGSLSFSADADGRPSLAFEVTELEARTGGSLRVGRREARVAATTPFERVTVARFAATRERPADLLLEVTSARTGRSNLSGTAWFTNVFPWARRFRWPGIDLDARWGAVGDAFEELKKSWGIERQMTGRLDADITARLEGPFTALAGRFRGVGRTARADVDLAPDRSVSGVLVLEGVDTAGLLHRSLVPALGGKLSGRIRAHGQLARRQLDLTAELDEAQLQLERVRRGPYPQRFNVWMGKRGDADGPDHLDLSVGGARLFRGELMVSNVRVSSPTASLLGAVSARIVDPFMGARLPVPLISAWARFDALDIASLSRSRLVGGRVAFRSSLNGPSDDLAFRVDFAPDSALRFLGRTFALPRLFEAQVLGGDRLVVSPVRIGMAGDAGVTFGGSVVFDGPIDARLGVEHYPLADLSPLPGLDVTLGGRFDAGLHVTGRTERPRLDGDVTFTNVAVAGERLGSGKLTISPEGPSGVRLDGEVIPALALRGRMRYAPDARLALDATLHRFPVGPFLDRRLPGLEGHLSGAATLEMSPHASQAALALDELALRYDRGAMPTVSLHNDGPVMVRATPGSVTLSPVRLRGPGLAVQGEGTLDGHGVVGKGSAKVSLQTFSAAFRPWLRDASGILEIAVQSDAQSSAGGSSAGQPPPGLSGSARVVEPVRVWPRRALVPLEVKSGGVVLGGRRLEVQRLALGFAGASLTLDGHATVDREAPLASRLDAQIDGVIDGADVARRLPSLVTQGHGRALVAGRVGGTASAPTFDGTIDFQGLGGEVPGLPAQVRSMVGRVEGQGRRLTTRGMTVDLAPKGHLVIGSPQLPSYIEVAELDPLTPGAFFGTARGTGLATLSPVAGLRLDDLDLDLRVAYQPDGPVRIGGDIWVDAAAFSPARRQPPPPVVRKTERVVKQLFPTIDLDVGMHVRNDGLKVVIPGLPRVGVTADCRIQGPLPRPTISGRARGKGLWSGLALGIFDLVSGQHLRSCGDRR